MERKTTKRILFILGVVIGIVGFGITMYTIFAIALYNVNIFNIFIGSSILCVGLILISIFMLMHAKDKRGAGERHSGLTKGAIILLIYSGMNFVSLTLRLTLR